MRGAFTFYDFVIVFCLKGAQMKYFTTIIIPETGDMQRPFPGFPEAQVKLDSAFRKFIGNIGFSFTLREPLTCSVYKAESGGEFEDLLGF